MSDSKYYVVWVGKNPGIYSSWEEASEQIHKFKGAKYKSYFNYGDALKAFTGGLLDAKSKGNKFYVVWKGKVPGVYNNWEDAKQQVDGLFGAKYKSFSTKAEADKAFKDDYNNHINKAEPKTVVNNPNQQPILKSVVVDAACSGNPGPVEYKGINLETKKVIFSQGPFQAGTNNIGEFLAIVHALALLNQHGSKAPIYSDSKIAIEWVTLKKCKTNLVKTEQNKVLFYMVARAEKWLTDNRYQNQILKWETKIWGENPADYGNK